MKKYGIAIFMLTMYALGFSQTIVKPNFALASHPMKVESILFTDKATIVELSVENKSATGFFCADKNISLINSLKSTEYLLVKSAGIPVCPETYSFAYVGEILKFKLFFSPVGDSVKYLDIIENCSDNCFSIKGIILDQLVNNEIDIAYKHYSNYNLDAALKSFKTAVDKNVNYPYAWLHYNILQIYAEKNDFASARKWYNKIINSNFRDKNKLIIKLKTKNYYKEMINQ